MISFFVILIISLFFAFVSQLLRKRKAISFIFACCTIASLGLFSGLRGKSVGIDTAAEYEILLNVLYGKYYFTKDVYSILISRPLLLWTKDPYSVIFLCSFLTITFIVLRFWTLSDKCPFPLSVCLFCSAYYVLSMNIMRQFLAVSIVFFASWFLEKKKWLFYLVFIAFNVFAVMIHFSAILGIAVLIFYLYKNHFAKKNYRLFVIIMFAMIMAPIIYYFRNSFDLYLHYFSEITFDFSIVTVYRLLVLLYLFFIVRITKKYKNDFDKIETYFFFSLAGIITSFIGMFFLYMDRIALYFLLFEIPLLSYVLKSDRNVVNRIVIAFPFMFLFVMEMINNGNGVFPYVPNWA